MDGCFTPIGLISLQHFPCSCVIFSRRYTSIQIPFHCLCIQPCSSFKTSCVCSCYSPLKMFFICSSLSQAIYEGSLAGSLTYWPGVKGKIWAHHSWPTMLQANSDSFSRCQGRIQILPTSWEGEASFAHLVIKSQKAHADPSVSSLFAIEIVIIFLNVSSLNYVTLSCECVQVIFNYEKVAS